MRLTRALLALAAAAMLLPSGQSAAQRPPDWARGRTGPEARALDLQIVRLSRQLRVSRATLEEIVRLLGLDPRRYSFAQIVALLEQRAGEAAELRGKLEALTRRIAQLEDPAIRDPAAAALARARAALDAGRLEEADRELAGLALLRRSDSQAGIAAWIEAVKARADVAMLRGRNVEAADLQFEAESQLAQLQARLDRERWLMIMGGVSSLIREGDAGGDNQALERALLMLRERALPLAPRGSRPLDWASTHNSIGVVLQVLGARDRGPALLQQAVDAYNLALEERTRAASPFGWAETNNNLGDTLQLLYERDRDERRLVRAIEAYGAVLEVRTPQNSRLGWAATQNSLGNALSLLGEARDDEAMILRAAGAYENGLEVLTPADPEWTLLNGNYANLLDSLGQRRRDPALVRASIERQRATIRATPRDVAAMDWAIAMHNLAGSLRRLAVMEGNPAHLPEAETTYLQALEIRTRVRAPLWWASSQFGLAEVLLLRGRLEDGTRRLRDAVAAYEGALEVWTEREHFGDWTMARSNRNLANILIAERTGDRGLLDRTEADVRALRRILERAGDAGSVRIQDVLLGDIERIRGAMAR